MKKLYQIASYIQYVLFSRHFRGGGIHSPFVFRQINVLFRERRPFYCFSKIEKLRNSLMQNNKEVFQQDFGTQPSQNRKIANIAKCALPKKYAQLLFRLVNDNNPQNILELGTSLGLTTAYLASVNSKSNCHTIEGAPEIMALAEQNFKKLYINNITTHVGNIDEILPEVLRQIPSLDFVYFDANHQKNATINYFNQCVEKIGEKSIFVFDDIYWSPEMTQAWKEIKKHPKVKVAIDIHEMGILYFSQELQKGDFVVRF